MADVETVYGNQLKRAWRQQKSYEWKQ